jgi:predicted nucleic acid-binding Zn ribbon protein
MQRLSDPPLTVCPACGGRYKKLISAPAFQFKGTGWYVTDYARKSASGKGEEKGAKEGEGGGAAKGEEAAGKEAKEPAEKKPAAEKKPTSKPSGSSAE